MLLFVPAVMWRSILMLDNTWLLGFSLRQAPHYCIPPLCYRRLMIKTNSCPVVAYCTSWWSGRWKESILAVRLPGENSAQTNGGRFTLYESSSVNPPSRRLWVLWWDKNEPNRPCAYFSWCHSVVPLIAAHISFPCTLKWQYLCGTF